MAAMVGRRLVLGVCIGASATWWIACRDDVAAPADAQPVAIVEGAAADVIDAGVEDARADAVATARATLDAGTFTGPYGRTTTIQTSVMSAPAWSEGDAGASAKLGYLRTNAAVPVVVGTIPGEGCAEGWLELVEGGYVCSKHFTLDADDPKLKWGPSPADVKAVLPYKYGVVMFDGTPIYKRALPWDKRRKYEPWLPSKSPSGAGGGDNPYADDDDDDKPKALKLRGKDGGKPTLDELHGRGAMLRRTMRGFLISGDHEVELQGAKWWRTAQGNLVPFDRVGPYNSVATLRGAWVGTNATGDAGTAGEAGTSEATGAAVIKVDAGAKYTADAEKKGIAGTGGLLGKGAAVALAGAPVSFWGVPYQQTTQGFWVKLSDVVVTTAQPPEDLGPDEKWIDVDLDKQLLVAFEGKRPVFATRVSSGRRNPYDLQHDYPTPTGSYRIREKHVTTTMDGDLAADGPYSIEDVPWVMYFKGSYALHGAFWHDSFGYPRSHGCINMSPADARDLFFWVEPRLPVGWHGAYSAGDHRGTRIVIHEGKKP
jgi:hypothetical protein